MTHSVIPCHNKRKLPGQSPKCDVVIMWCVVANLENRKVISEARLITDDVKKNGHVSRSFIRNLTIKNDICDLFPPPPHTFCAAHSDARH